MCSCEFSNCPEPDRVRSMRGAEPRRWRGGAAAIAAAVFLGTFWGGVTPAYATTAAEKAAAETLFDEGVKLLKTGELAEACSKLEQSQRIDPGIGTLLYLGECYEKSGRTASAWATFREASSMAQAAGQNDRARIGQQRADRLAPRLSKLVIELDPGIEATEGLEIRSDGQLVSRALWGTALPVDPGDRTLKISAPGYESQELHVQVAADGATQTVRVPALRPEPEAVVAPGSSVGVGGSSGGPGDSGARPGDTQRTLGLITGALGVAGLGVGGVFGILAISKNDEASGACGGATCTTQAGVDATNQALDFATVADVGFIAGGVLLAAGAVLYFTAPDGTEVSSLRVAPTLGGAAFSWGGTF